VLKRVVWRDRVQQHKQLYIVFHRDLCDRGLLYWCVPQRGMWFWRVLHGFMLVRGMRWSNRTIWRPLSRLPLSLVGVGRRLTDQGGHPPAIAAGGFISVKSTKRGVL
jgi:hypothetical protein